MQTQNKEKVAKETLEAAQKFAKDLEQMSVTVLLKVGDNGRVFGSISAKEIAEAAKKQLGIDIDKKKLIMETPIKSLGVTMVPLRLHPKVIGELKVQVKEQK